MGRQVNVRVRKPHYRDHVYPIWVRLPNEVKGPGITMIGGWSDRRPGQPYIYVEHGAGQSWVGVEHPSYSGGPFHEDCELFLCPNNDVARRWRQRYPDIPAAVVGSPRLDKYHNGVIPPPKPKTVAITFHWDCRIVPEARSAFQHYRRGLPNMVKAYRRQGWTVLGHAHPRERSAMQRFWTGLGVEWTADPLEQASVLIADATSMQAEFLSCARPVVALNCPYYRKDVHHGARFWEWEMSASAESAAEAAQIELDALEWPGKHPYAYNDGRASERAVEAILEVL